MYGGFYPSGYTFDSHPHDAYSRIIIIYLFIFLYQRNRHIRDCDNG